MSEPTIREPSPPRFTMRHFFVVVAIVAVLIILGQMTRAQTQNSPPSSAAAAFCAEYSQFIQDTNAAASNPALFSQVDADEQKMDAYAQAAGNPFEADIIQGQTSLTGLGPIQQDCTNAGY